MLAIALVAGAMLLLTSPSASAEGVLAQSEPSANAVLASPPKTVQLWFNRSLGVSAAEISVFDMAGHRVDSGSVRLTSPASPGGRAGASIGLRTLPDGVYTVSWQATLQTGTASQDAFVFQVGSQGLPGAATMSGQAPSWPAVVLRWLVIVGLSVIAAWFVLVLLGAQPAEICWPAALGGAGLSLICDLLLVPVTVYLPAAGGPAIGLSTAWSLMPSSWRGRLVVELALLVVAAWMVWRRSERPAALAGGLLTLAAVATLVSRSHAAAQQPTHPLLIADGVHLACAMVWIGGLVFFAIAPSVTRGGASLAFRRYAHLVLYLIVVTIATGAMEAGVMLPSLASFWQSQYGKALILKLIVVIAILIVLFLSRMRLWSAALTLTQARRSLRIEAGLGCLAVLLASTMAMAAMPTAHPNSTLDLRLDLSNGLAAHLELSPAGATRDQFDLWLTGENDQPVSGVSGASLSLTSLSSPVSFASREASAESNGRWRLSGVPLYMRGWWRAEVRFTGTGGARPAEADFYLLLPDPILTGLGGNIPSDPQAEEIYTQAIAKLTELKSVRIDENLSDGIGNGAASTTTYVAPDKESYVTNLGNKSIAISDTQWYLIDGSWQPQSLTDPINFPASLPAIYSGPQDLQLGQTEMVDGELCQIITFEVPAIPQSRDVAWYAWWIGTKSHQLRREAMVSSGHYALSHYYDQNQPFTIKPPTSGISAP